MTEPYFNTKLQSESYNFFYRNTLLKMERQIRKKIQLIAARIVTSLPIIASRESLYFETWGGGEDLQQKENIQAKTNV